MFDVVQAQKDIFAALLSSDQLLTVNVVLQRQMALQNVVDQSTIVTTPRGGAVGVGVLVEQPLATCESNNVTGAVLDWAFPVVILENPTLNYAPATQLGTARGSGIDCEVVLQRVVDELHCLADERWGTLKIDRDAVKWAGSEFPGLLAYRVPFMLYKAKSIETPRTGPVIASIVGGTCTLSCAKDPDAEIWFTTDLTSPGNENGGNPSSLLYSAPFQVDDSVTAVRARAFAAGKKGGETKYVLNV